MPERISTLTDEEYEKLHRPFKSDPETKAMIEKKLRKAGERKEGKKLVNMEVINAKR